MSFSMPKGAKRFFHQLPNMTAGGERYLMFDSYYVCCLLGLRHRKLGAEDDVEGENFVASYPAEYRPQADYIAGLLIEAELARKQIKPDDKNEVEREMILLLDPMNGLSDPGLKFLNRYAAGGFAILQNEMLAPAKHEDLLVKYAELWSEDV